ncbi:hypothetical protein D3C80_1727450 [compost metagenome]
MPAKPGTASFRGHGPLLQVYRCVGWTTRSLSTICLGMLSRWKRLRRFPPYVASPVGSAPDQRSGISDEQPASVIQAG